MDGDLWEEADNKYEVWYVRDNVSGLVGHGHTKREALCDLNRKLKDSIKRLLEENEKEG